MKSITIAGLLITISDSYRLRLPNDVRDDRNYFGEAIKDFTKAIRLKPDEAKFYYNRSRIRLKWKEWDGAKSDLTCAKEKGLDTADTFLKSKGGNRATAAEECDEGQYPPKTLPEC